MKKFISFFIVLLLVVMPFVDVDAKSSKKTKKTTTTTITTQAKDPVNVHIFYGSTCGFCQALHEYIDELEKDKSVNHMFKVVDYEVWGSTENSELMGKVGEYFDYEVTGVPFYVIGEKYFSGFSETSTPEQIVDAIKTAYSDANYKDIVAGIQDGSISYNGKKEGKDYTSWIILGITAVIIVAIFVGRANTTYYDDEEKEEVSEVKEVKTEEKPEPKKEVTKKKTDVKKTTTKEKTNNKTTSTKTTTKKNTKKTK